MREIRHFAQEACIGILRNWRAALAASILLFIAVLLLACLLFLRTGVADLYRYIDSQLEMKIYVKADYAATEVAAAIESLSVVKQVRVVTGEEQLTQMALFFQDKPRLLTAFADGGLPDAVSVAVTAHAELAGFAERLREMPAIEAVVYPQKFAEQVARWTTLIQKYGASMLLLLAVAGFLTVYIAIRLALLQRNQEVRLKLLLGANPRLVTMQFLMEGVLMGAIGGLPAAMLAVLACNALVHTLRLEIPALFHTLSDVSLSAAWTIALAGPLMSMAAAWLAVRGWIRHA